MGRGHIGCYETVIFFGRMDELNQWRYYNPGRLGGLGTYCSETFYHESFRFMGRYVAAPSKPCEMMYVQAQYRLYRQSGMRQHPPPVFNIDANEVLKVSHVI